MGKLVMLKTTIVSGIMAGSIAFGALVTYNGGAAIDLAQSKITQQAEELGLFKSQQTQLVEKLTAVKERLAYLEENGTDADQAEIDRLTTEAATLQTNIDTAGGQITDEINRLEGEINKANTDAAELEQTVVDAGETPEAMYQSQLDILTDSVPEGYAILKMMSDTPQIVYDKNGQTTKLTIDKTVANAETAHLVIRNDGSLNYYLTFDNGSEILLAAGEQYDFGLVEDIDAKTLSIKDAYRMDLGNYYLTVQ